MSHPYSIHTFKTLTIIQPNPLLSLDSVLTPSIDSNPKGVMLTGDDAYEEEQSYGSIATGRYPIDDIYQWADRPPVRMTFNGQELNQG